MENKDDITLTITNMPDARKIACEWFGEGTSIMHTWLSNAIVDTKQHRDLGKVLAYVTEIYVINYIQQLTGRCVAHVSGKPFDAITTDDKPEIKIQIKFRKGPWHLETTRRVGKKNTLSGSAESGHVVYSFDEFDLLCIFIPGPGFGITRSKIRFIPVTSLIDPHNPNNL